MRSNEPVKFIVWTEKLRIGVDSVDREHEWLTSDFNAVVAALGTIDDRRLLEKMLDTFVTATARHFENEEAEMERAGFVDLEVHRERHQFYLIRLQHLNSKFHSGADIKDELTTYFASWMSHHVAVTDRKFGDFLMAQADDGRQEPEFEEG